MSSTKTPGDFTAKRLMDRIKAAAVFVLIGIYCTPELIQNTEFQQVNGFGIRHYGPDPIGFCIDILLELKYDGAGLFFGIC